MITFVIPALNEEFLIGRCIHAIEREVIATGIDAEIIVVNNGSTDSTNVRAWEARPSHPAIVFRVVEEPRRGLLQAKQTGLGAARGDLVAFIDADCMLRLGWLTKVIERFADARVEAMSGPYHYYDLPWEGRVASGAVFKLMGGLNYLMPVVLGGNSVFRTDTLRRLGGFDTSIQFWGEDTWTAVQMAAQGSVVFSSKLKVDSSGRRLIGQGYLATLWAYMRNSVAVRLTGKPAEQIHKQYR
jgi:glycosyltransferase involved in cell wall biosynthesis